MNFGSNVKKNFTTNHRANYAIYNKSNIFDTVGNTQSKLKEDTNVNKKAPVKKFEPKFQGQEETAYSRKLKEFYNKDNLITECAADVKTSKNFITKDRQRENQTPPKGVLNAREKKLLELNPKLTVDDLKTLKTSKSFYEKTTTENNFDPTKSTKDFRVSQMDSNIFHDPQLQRTKSQHLLKIKQDQEEAKKKERLETEKALLTQTPKTTKNKTNVRTNFSWLNTNTEVVFNKDPNSKPVTASEMKKKQLTSALDNETAKNYCQTPKNPTQKVDNHEEVKECLTDRFGNNNALKKKAMELSSSLHSNEFYSTNYKSAPQEKEIESFEINAKSGFDKLNSQEIKYLFSTKGYFKY